MKLVCLVLILVVQWAAASLPCNPAAAFHGSECTCPTQSGAHFRSFVVAIPYPTFRRESLDVEVQQTEEQGSPKKWETLDYHQMRMPVTSNFAFRMSPTQEQLPKLEPSVSQFTLQSPCQCGGLNCNCGAAPSSAAQYPSPLPPQMFAPMNFYPGGQQRFRRSVDSGELNADELAFIKESTPVMSKKGKSSASFKDPHSQELFGDEDDTFVLERQHY